MATELRWISRERRHSDLPGGIGAEREIARFNAECVFTDEQLFEMRKPRGRAVRTPGFQRPTLHMLREVRVG